jgi:hypothetical protein
MVSARSNSGAEVAAVQTLRDQRMLQSSFDFEFTPWCLVIAEGEAG